MSIYEDVVIFPAVGYHGAMTKPMKEAPILSRAERNRLQLRADIIQAAFEEFSSRGYHQTAIADIAKRLGIGHGTFYRHFENKRDILDHVINDVSARVMTLVAENSPTAVSSLEEYREQTSRIASRMAEMLAENPAMVRLLLFEATSIDAEMTGRVQDLLDWAGKLTAAYMENGVRLHFFRADLDAEATGHAVVGMILAGVMRFLRAPENREEQNRLRDATQRLLIDGIAR